MSIEISRKLYDFCEQAYQDMPGRTAFSHPAWVLNLKTDGEAARVAHTCLQAAMLAMLQQTGAGGRLEGLDLQDLPPASYIDSLITVIRMNEGRTNEAVAPALETLRDYLRFTGMPKDVPTWDPADGSANPLHALATEAAGRQAAAVTPVEVTQYMLDLAGCRKVHAYAVDGLGLLYGGCTSDRVALVGDEFKAGNGYQRPAALENTLEMARVWFQAPEFANRVFLDLDSLVTLPAANADVLLFNAARQDLPFYPAGTEEEDLSSNAGGFNHCLTAGYDQVVVLVSNHYLTAGRGRAERILRHCLQHGLRKIVQLPMGVLGVRSQAHSILVFGRDQNTSEIELVNLMEAPITIAAPRGFGQPRRARKLAFGASASDVARQTVSVQSLLERQQGVAKSRKLLSFEVGQFMVEDPLEPLRARYEFMRMGAFMEVFRSHHVAETGDPNRTQYSETGAAYITEEGTVQVGRVRDCASDALQRRRAQILKDEDLILCFRGSPDSYGKAGIYRHRPGQTVVPNQSFVILRRKADAPANAPTAAQVLWWLQSAYAQRYLQTKAIAPDVMRVAPRDIDAMEVPCGPTWLIEQETERLERAQQAAQKINELRAEVATLLAKAWR